MDIIQFGRINVTQVATTAIAVIGLMGLVFAAFRTTVFKMWTDWKISQLEANNLILRKQQELADELHNIKKGQNDLQACIHALPDHPENPTNGTPLD